MSTKAPVHEACVLVVCLRNQTQPPIAALDGIDGGIRASLAALDPAPAGEDRPPPLAVLELVCESERLARSYLDAREVDEMSRIREPATRDAFVAAHASLRIVLGTACGMEPREVPIDRTANGKPFVPIRGAPHFSLAHAKGAFAIAWGNVPMGVDIEHADGLRAALHEDIGAIASRYFSAGEQAQLEDAAAAGRTDAFLRIWTRKEALVKAAGATLEALARIDTVKSTRVTLDDGGAYCVHSLAAGTRFHLAFAARAAAPMP